MWKHVCRACMLREWRHSRSTCMSHKRCVSYGNHMGCCACNSAHAQHIKALRPSDTLYDLNSFTCRYQFRQSRYHYLVTIHRATGWHLPWSVLKVSATEALGLQSLAQLQHRHPCWWSLWGICASIFRTQGRVCTQCMQAAQRSISLLCVCVFLSQ